MGRQLLFAGQATEVKADHLVRPLRRLATRPQADQQTRDDRAVGLDLDPDNRSALTNIASLYRTLGKTGAANRYSRRIRAYQRRNPYFHYSRARYDFENDNIDDALKGVTRAIKLKKNEHQFYFLMGLIDHSLGNQQEALQSFIKARELAGFESTQQEYDAKIALLVGSQP